MDFPALMVNKAVPGGALLIAVMAIRKKKSLFAKIKRQPIRKATVYKLFTELQTTLRK